MPRARPPSRNPYAAAQPSAGRRRLSLWFQRGPRNEAPGSAGAPGGRRLAPFGVRGYNGRVKGVVVLAVVLGAVFATNAAAAPRPHVERAQTATVQAVFSYSWDPAKFRFSRQHIAITRDGATRFSANLRKPPGNGANAQPAGFFSHKRS